jgi:DNA-binding protein H-NS
MKKKSSFDHGPLLDIDQDISIVASAPHEGAPDWESMSIEDLWTLHEKIAIVLTTRMLAEKGKLEKRLLQLGKPLVSPKPVIAKKSARSKRRPYPQVKPKYRNRADPSVTWSGRGKRPRWLSEQISRGKKLEDFKIH